MGWRYRKRIKIFPGVHINISKSGISTNIGVRGASVTFGPKGTYVNTGIPGTGLYRRDKIPYNRMNEGLSGDRCVSEPTLGINQNKMKEFDEKTCILKISPILYILFSFALVFPIAAFVWYLDGMDMLSCYLINTVIQLFLSIGIITNISSKVASSSRIIHIKDMDSVFIRKEILGHYIGCFLSILVIVLNLFPIYSMNATFMRIICGYEIVWTFDFFVLFIVALIVSLWTIVFVKERKSILAINKISLMEQDLDSNNQNSQDEVSTDTAELSVKPDDTAQIETNTEGTEYKQGKNALKERSIDVHYDPKLDLPNYQYPPIDILSRYEDDNIASFKMDELAKNKDCIIRVLLQFGIELSSIRATVSSRFTLYEVTIAPMVNSSKIMGLKDDIALALYSHNVKIAPVPNKGTIGIEVPNRKFKVVSIESILNSRTFQETTMSLPCALGKTMTNNVFIFDLTKAPHVLIAGSSGQGKSTALHAIITSLLYKKHPAEMKLVLMDSRGVEFGLYQSISNHFLANYQGVPSIIENGRDAGDTLFSLCLEMDSRYKLLSAAGVRDIKDYNLLFVNRHLNPAEGHRYMPYLVVAIDSFSDLILGYENIILPTLTRLTKRGRAVGIHLIIATERPTSNLIPSEIKSFIPTRVSFRVPERIDSEVILDEDGAENLLGDGDMLFKDKQGCTRLQCAYIDTQETSRLVSFIASQQRYVHSYQLPMSMENEGGGVTDVDMSNLDPMLEEAALLIVNTQQGSTSLIQCTFSIGYNRAGRIMDQLEYIGVVGPALGSNPREVIVQDKVSLETIFRNLTLK